MQTDNSAKHLIFISHSSKDAWVAKQIARWITDCGATPFLDEAGVEIGEDFDDRILVSLNQANELLVLLTPWALERPYIWAELGVAWGRQIPIVVVLHGVTSQELQTQPSVPLFVKKRNLIDINELDTYFRQLTARATAG